MISKKISYLLIGLPENIIGILLMLSMVFAGLILSGLVKIIGQTIDFRVLMVGRFLFSLPIIYVFGWYLRKEKIFSVNAKFTLFGRVSVGLIGICLWFSAIRFADFGQVTALTQSSAVFVTLLAPIFLSERIGIWRLSAVVIGLIGIVLTTNPLDGNLSIGVYLAIAGAISSAVLSILMRKLGSSDEPVTVVLWHNTIGTIVFTTSLLIYVPEIPILNIDILLLLITLGIFGAFLQLSFTYAYKFGEAMVLAPIRYLAVPGALFAGYLIWNEVPSIIQLIGAIITVFSCVIISWREIVKKNTH